MRSGKIGFMLAASCCVVVCGLAYTRENATTAPASRPAAGGKTPAWAKVSKEQIAAAKRLGLPVALENSVGMKFVLIPAGEFWMGSPETETMRGEEETRHKVRITRPFYMGIHEVTQEQYKAVTGANPSYRKQKGAPVEQVSIIDAEQKFFAKLNKKEGKTYWLATEAQWEYACRAGSKGRYCFGDDAAKLGDYAWYVANSDKKAHPVGLKKPNAWGLYDMHGNVWEWCSCYLVPYGKGPRTDPVGEKGKGRRGREKVVRGGAYVYKPEHLRSAMRYSDSVGDRHDIIGFRAVLWISTN